MDIKQIVGRNVKLFRKSINMTQEELAELLGVKFQAISSIECGKNFVTDSTLNKLCKIFNKHPQDFFTGDIVNKSSEKSEYVLMISEIIKELDEASLKYIYKICKIFNEKI